MCFESELTLSPSQNFTPNTSTEYPVTNRVNLILVPLSNNPLIKDEIAIKLFFYSHIVINDCMLIKLYVRTWRTKSWHFPHALMGLDLIPAYPAMLVEN